MNRWNLFFQTGRPLARRFSWLTLSVTTQFVCIALIATAFCGLTNAQQPIALVLAKNQTEQPQPQTTDANNASAEAEEEPFDDGDIFGEKRRMFALSVGNPVGFKAYAPGRWGLVGATITNRTAEPQKVDATAVVDINGELRFSREILIPPFTTRSTTVPIHIPANVPTRESIEITGRVVGDGKVQDLELNYLARLIGSQSVAYIKDILGNDGIAEEGFDFSYESVLSLREAVGLNRRMVLFNERLLPASIEGWDVVRSVVLAGERTDVSPAARQAFRQWISEGGRVWIQMNEMSPDTVKDLLGSAIEFEVIDKVMLNSYQFEFAPGAEKAVPVAVDIEQPVELIRMVLGNGEVRYTVDGWPAMFKVSLGRGEVYFTTLESRGWIRPRQAGDRPFSDPLLYTDFVALEPLRDLANILRFEPETRLASEDVVSEFVTSRVGYEVPSRSFVIASLLGFCALISGAAVLLSIWRIREYLGLATILGGALAAIIILLPGWNSKKDIPTTASSFQVVQMLPQSAQLSASGQLALFNGEPAEAQMFSNMVSRVNPQSDAMAGKIRNLHWTDAIHWRWRDTLLAPGIQLMPFEHTRSLSQPVVAKARLGSDGIEGQFTWPVSEISDAQWMEDGLIAFPGAPVIAAKVQPDGKFQAGASDLLADGQYYNTTFTTDEQRRHQPVIDAWLKNYLDSPNADPYLLVWMEGLGTGLGWPEDVRVLDASLVAIPLALYPSDENIDVQIPASVLVPRAIVSAMGQSSVFDNAKRAWIYPYARTSSTRIRFQLPKEVLPLEVKSAKLLVDCNIPSRKLEIMAVDGDQLKLVSQRTNAAGQFTVDLDEETLPPLDETGGLTLEFAVSELLNKVEEETVANSAWSIRKTLLTVSGTRKAANE